MTEGENAPGRLAVRESAGAVQNAITSALVLGMHRSGTSAVAGIMCALGCWVGDADDLMEAGAGNRTGYFERKRTADVLDTLLEVLGGSWWQPPLDKLTPLDLVDIRPRLRQVIDEVFLSAPDGKVALVKDPRLCLFGAELASLRRPGGQIVVCVRNPVAVARSLLESHNLPLRTGLALWEAYNATLCTGLTGVPVHVVNTSLDALDVAAMERFISALQLPGADRERVAAAVAHHLHPEHVRQWVTSQDEVEWLTNAQVALWQALAEAARSAQPSCLDPVAISASARDALRQHDQGMRDTLIRASEREALEVARSIQSEDRSRLEADWATTQAELRSEIKRLEAELAGMARLREADLQDRAALEAQQGRAQEESVKHVTLLEADLAALSGASRQDRSRLEAKVHEAEVSDAESKLELARLTHALGDERLLREASEGLAVALKEALAMALAAHRLTTSDLTDSRAAGARYEQLARQSAQEATAFSAAHAEAQEVLDWLLQQLIEQEMETRRQRDHALMCFGAVTTSRSWRLGLGMTWPVRHMRRRRLAAG